MSITAACPRQGPSTRAVLLVLGLGTAAPALAETVFTASATADLTLLDIRSTGDLSGVSITRTGEETEAPTVTGRATLDAYTTTGTLEDPLGLGLGFDLSIGSFADGRAGDDAGNEGGTSVASYTNFAIMTIANGSTEAITLNFDVQYSADAGVSATAALLEEDALATADVLVLVDGILEYSTSTLADLSFGPPNDAFGDFALFEVLVGAGETRDVELYTAVSGFAIAAPVPIPAALPLLAGGLAATGLVGRRRRTVAPA